MNESKVRRKVLNFRIHYLGQALNQDRLMWLKHALHLFIEGLSHSKLLSEAGAGWKMVRGGH